MAKIITITANTALDFFIEVDGLVGRDTVLAQKSADFACGKGVNVAKAVSCLNYPALCLGFVGEQSLDAFNALNNDYIGTDFTAVTGKTRTNITLRDLTEQKETHIRTAGFSVNAQDCCALFEAVVHQVQANDIVILSGSLPPGAPDDLYRELIRLCRDKQALCFLDSNGVGLQEGVKAAPFLLKPNLHELEELVGRALMDQQAIVSAVRQLIDTGIQYLYVSMGRDGFLVVNREKVFAVCVPLIPQHTLSTVGCGDAMLAGLAVAMLNHESSEESIKLAAACATANLFSIEPGCFSKRLVTEFIPRVRIEAKDW